MTMAMLMLRTPMMMMLGDDGDDAGVSGSRGSGCRAKGLRGCADAMGRQWLWLLHVLL